MRRWAHELRNAFNSLRLCTAALEICGGTWDQLEILEQIERSASRTAALMDGPAGESLH